MRETLDTLLIELKKVIDTSNFEQVQPFVEKILESKTIVTFGAGRVGLMMRSFSMRLAHLGFKSFFLLDSNVPNVKKGDTLIVGSGSGNTLSVANMAELAAEKDVTILLITANEVSRVAKVASCIIRLNSQTKAYENDRPSSIQPMTSLFEQTLLLTLDALVIELMDVTRQSKSDLEARHNILE